MAENRIDGRLRRLEGRNPQAMCAESFAAWAARLPADDALRVQAAEELRQWRAERALSERRPAGE